MAVRLSTGSLAWLLLAALAGQPVRAGEEADLAACDTSLPAVRGLSVSAGTGPALWAGEVGEASRPGPAFSLSVAYDLFDWLAVEAGWHTGSNDTAQPYPPAPGSFATQVALLGMKLRWLLGSWDLFARGGVGFRWVYPNILLRIENLAEGTQLAWSAGGGVGWYTPIRGLWLAAESLACGAIDGNGIWISTRLVLGYTFPL